MHSPKISIVTPSFNQGHYLEQTILSVLEQNYPNLEYIIIDGGSRDNSVGIIKKYSAHISYWVSEPDRGQSDALEKGFRKATGEIAAWINSDDYYEKGAFDKVATHYQQHPFSFLCGTCRMIDPDDRLVQHLRTPSISYRSLLRYWRPHFCPPQPSIFFRMDILRELGYFDTSLRYAMDFDLWLKASEKYRFHCIPDNLSYYRVHAGSKTGSDGGLRKFIPEWKRVIARSLHDRSPFTRYAFHLQENVHTLKTSLQKWLPENVRKTGIPENIPRFPERSNVCDLRWSCFDTLLLGRNLAVTDNGPPVRSKPGLKPLITVIIPCYNYGRLLAEALQSLQEQDCQDWECWIIDDGSTDTTAAIARQYTALDPRINYYYQHNQGQPSARNRGLEQARGDYIQFLDADDLLEPCKFSRQKAYLEEHPGTDIVYGEVRYFMDHEPGELFLNRWDGRAEVWMPKISGHGLPMLMALVEKNIFELGCALFSRHAVNAIGPFQETLQGVEDYDYCLRAAALDLNFAWLDAPETRVLMRHHSSSFSKSLFSMYKKELMLRRLWKTRLRQTGSEHLVLLNDLRYDGRLRKLQDLVIDQVRKGNTSYLKIKEMKWLWTHASNRQKLYFFPRILKALLQRSKTSPYVNTDVTIK